MKIFIVRRTHILFALCILITFLSTAPVFAQQYTLPSEGAPGEVLLIRAGENENGITRVVLSDADGRTVSDGRVFDLDGDATILLGLSATVLPGEYLLKVYDGESTFLGERGFRVRSKRFREDRINLDGELTLLRTREDDLKREEALEIQAIYASFNPGSVFSPLSFVSPVHHESLDYFRISSDYGDRRIFHYSNDKTSQAIHTGIDMAAGTGVSVYTAAAGRVVLARERIISGLSIVIEHLPGVYTVYFHLDSLDVTEGEMVHQDQKIGTVGMTGLATGPHLHWEIRVNGVAVDPRPLTQVEIPDTIHATTTGE